MQALLAFGRTVGQFLAWPIKELGRRNILMALVAALVAWMIVPSAIFALAMAGSGVAEQAISQPIPFALIFGGPAIATMALGALGRKSASPQQRVWYGRLATVTLIVGLIGACRTIIAYHFTPIQLDGAEVSSWWTGVFLMLDRQGFFATFDQLPLARLLLFYGLPLVCLAVGLAALWGETAATMLRQIAGQQIDTRKRAEATSVYGSAAWLNSAPERMRQFFLRADSPSGLIFGQLHTAPTTELLSYPLEAHMITIAPSRSGKGVFIAGNLLAGAIGLPGGWTGPVIVIDPKPESYFIAAPARQKLRRQVLMDPFAVGAGLVVSKGIKPPVSMQTGRYNFLDVVRPGEDGWPDIDGLAANLLPAGTSGENNAWVDEGGRTILQALILTVANWHADIGVGRSLVGVLQLWVRGETAVKKLWHALAAKPECHFAATMLHAAAGYATAEGTGGAAYRSAVTGALKWIHAPQMQAILQTSDFSMDDLFGARLDIYLTMHPDHLAGNGGWFRLFLALPSLLAARGIQPKQRLLIIADEAGVIGKSEAIERGFKLAAGGGISYWALLQDVHTLRKVYGEEGADSMLANSQIVQVFGANRADKKYCEEVSAMLGKVTYQIETSSESAGESRQAFAMWGGKNEGTSTNTQLVSEDLMKPDDIAQMTSDEQIIMAQLRDGKRQHPIHAYKVRYFERPELKDYAAPNPHRSSM